MALKSDWNTGDSFSATAQNDVATAVNAMSPPQFGTYAARPAAGDAGLMYYCTDCDSVYYDNGSVWTRVRVGNSVGPPIGDVPTTGWTAVNMQTGCTWAADKDGMLFTMPSNGAGEASMYQYRTYPAGAFTLTCYFDYEYGSGMTTPAGNTWATAGFVISDGTKHVSFGIGDSGFVGGSLYQYGYFLYLWKWATIGATGALYTGSWSPPYTWLGDVPHWWRFVDDTVNRSFQFSKNGIDWHTCLTVGRTDYLTPTRIGIGGSNFGGSTQYLRVRSWNGVS